MRDVFGVMQEATGMSCSPIAVCMFDNEVVRGGAEEHMLCLLRGL